MTTLTIEKITPNIGAVVTGVDFSKPLVEAQQHEIEHALLTHQVLFFRKQAITPKQQADLRANLAHCIFTRFFPKPIISQRLYCLIIIKPICETMPFGIPM